MSNDTTRAALRQALEALINMRQSHDFGASAILPILVREARDAIIAAEAALAAPQGEAVLYVNTMYLAGRRKEADLNGQMLEVVTRTSAVFADDTPLYATPAPARAEPTDAEIDGLNQFAQDSAIRTGIAPHRALARAVLALRNGGES